MARKEKLLAMLENDPDDPFLHYALGQEYISEGDRARAVTQLQEVIARFPGYHAAHFQLGQLLAEGGETEQASQVLKDGIQAAREAGDQHAQREMSEFLETLSDGTAS